VRRNLGWILLIPLLAACETTTTSNGQTAASCVGPYLDDQPRVGGRFGAPPPTVHPGEVLTVYGHWYTSTCNDTGEQDPLQPLPSVRLTLTLPGGDTRRLGRHTPAGPDMGFSVSVRIPARAHNGSATISDDRGGAGRATFKYTIAGH
jgi:hypothetical protein